MRPLLSFASKLFPVVLTSLPLAMLSGAAVQAPAQSEQPFPLYGYHWVGSWGASPSAPWGGLTTPASGGQTLRLTAHLSLPSTNGLRVRFSNALTAAPVTFGAVHLALWAGSASNVTSAIVPGSDQVVTFNGGSGSVTIAAGGDIVSDVLSFKAAAGQDIAVSIYLAAGSPQTTLHSLAQATSYFAPGNQTANTVLTGAGTTASRAYLTGVDVLAPVAAAAAVTLGDSITDGAFSTMDGDNRWPDDLGVRLRAAYGNNTGIVNAGIASNRLLLDGINQNAQARFDRDVLSVPGVKFLIVAEGINDIGNDTGITSAQLIAGLQAIIARGHDAGLYVYGATITPDYGSPYYSSANEQIRQSVNYFIRNIAPFDGVIDFDTAIADPANPLQILPKYQGDFIHPNPAGYQAMANVINLLMFNPYTH